MMRCFGTCRLGLGLLIIAASAMMVTPSLADVKRTDSSALAAEKRKNEERARRKGTTVQPKLVEERIPIPAGQSLKVKRSETLKIQLETLADEHTEPVQYKISEPPEAGTLSEPIPIDGDLAKMTYVYTPKPDATKTLDMVWFKTRYPEGRWSHPHVITIQIQDLAPVMQVQGNVDFGNTIVGTTSVKTVRIANVGDDTFEGGFEMQPPWEWISDKKSILVEPGAEEHLKFRFSPTDAGQKVFRLAVGTGDKGSIRFTGAGFYPLELSADDLKLTYDTGVRTRNGTLTVKSKGKKGVEMKITTPERLEVWKNGSEWLRGGEERMIKLRVRPDDPSPFVGTFAIQVGGYKQEVKITADPVPAWITLDAELSKEPLIDFGVAKLGEKIIRPLTFVNKGGIDSSVRIPLKSPFSLLQDDEDIIVQANSEREVTLVYYPKSRESVIQSHFIEGLAYKVPITLSGTVEREEESLLGVESLNSGDGEAEFPEDSIGRRTSSAGGRTIGGNSGSSGGRNPNQAMGSAERSSIYTNIGKREKAPPTLEELTDQKNLLVDSTKSFKAAVNIHMAIPPMISRSGHLAHSPFRKKLNIGIPHIRTKIATVKATGSKLGIVWKQPHPKAVKYEAEMRTSFFNTEKKRYEVIWIPFKTATFTIKDSIVTANLSQLKPKTYYVFRFFVIGNNSGAHSLPSAEHGVTTSLTETSMGSGMFLGFLGLIALTIVGMYVYVRRAL